LRTIRALSLHVQKLTTSMLAVHAVSGHAARGDGSFHLRLKFTQANEAVLSAPPDLARLSAKVLQEYHSSDISALVVDGWVAALHEVIFP
jgi:hypothetical protein